MNAKHILPLIALGVAAAQAGERETFDFDWKFKYFGSEDPAEAGSPTWCNGYQGGHPASNAIDGKLDTRWCAPGPESGNVLEIAPGFTEPVKLFMVYWERPNYFDINIKVSCKDASKDCEFSFNNGGQAASFVVLPEPSEVKRVSITVKGGTDVRTWASIREVLFTGTNDKQLKVKRGAGALTHARVDASEDGYKAVQLPHDWAIESPFLENEPNETGKLPWNGWGWYRKNFNVPADFDAEKNRWYLDFDGVMSRPQVYVNGQKAGEWAYGYNSFRVDITPFLKPGEQNLVAVMASNLPLSTRWYPGAGIYRHVWLEKTGPVHLTQWPTYVTTPSVTADNATVKVQTTVTNTGHEAAEVTVMQSVEGAAAVPATITLAPGTEASVEQEIHLPSPRLWSCESPNLYKLQTSVLMNGKEIDNKETVFGVRTAEWRKDGFYLNGNKVRIKGVCEHHDLGALGAAFNTRAYERKIEMLKEMGCNSIRMTHNPPAPEVLDLCDKHGILVIDELFDIWKRQKYDKVNGYHLYWDEWWQKDVQNFMLRDRNHPSIIAWSGGNEVPEQSMWDIKTIRANKDNTYKTQKELDEAVSYAEKVNALNFSIAYALRDEIRKYDVTRPYTVGCNDQSAYTNGFADTVDLFGFNYKPHLYAKFRIKHPEMPYYGSETCSCVGTRDTYNFPLTWGVGGGYFKPGAVPHQVSAYGLASTHWGSCPDIEMHAHTKAPDLAGEYVWTGFDYIGEPTPYNQDATIENNLKNLPQAEREAIMREYEAMGSKAIARSSYFGIIDLAGFPKDIYYLYQSQWNPDKAQAHILPHWNWAGREGQKTPVMVFTSGDEAELFVNGKSQGVRKRGQSPTFTQKDKSLVVSKNQYRFTWEDVVYEPGTVEVVVKKGGKHWVTAKRVTTGNATAVQATPDRSAITGDGYDISSVALALTDAAGNVVPTDSRKVSFSIEGPAELAGFCNGDPTDWTCMQDKNQRFFNGRILAVVRGKRGESGTATVTVKADGLPEIKVPITIESMK
ncbi:MAG: DUF4982 domain-containing protein [Akkermansia sp.]|nr:DUF4982 domain-containing protein [Akkermansia sp.]